MRLGILAGLLLACDPAPPPVPRPAPVASPTPEPPAPQPEGLPPPRDPPDEALRAQYPSLVHYPEVPPPLAAGLRARDVDAILFGLTRAFAASRWAHIDAWERLAHIRIAEPAGYVRTEAGAPVKLSPGTYDLGCFGGFLEGVRLLYLPRVELAELIACDPVTAFDTCEGGAHAGLAALLQLGARLPPDRLPRGLDLQELRPGDEHPDLAAALDPDALHLCTVSHRARARGGARMYHHMMILDPRRDHLGRVAVFDTTGAAGVAVRRMGPERLTTYVRRLLALSDVFRYDPASARLSCLAVRRPAPPAAP